MASTTGLGELLELAGEIEQSSFAARWSAECTAYTMLLAIETPLDVISQLRRHLAGASVNHCGTFYRLVWSRKGATQ
jgi:hypothetical protein